MVIITAYLHMSDDAVANYKATEKQAAMWENIPLGHVCQARPRISPHICTVSSGASVVVLWAARVPIFLLADNED